MLVAFLDEAKPPADGWFARGGLILADHNLLDLEKDFASILRDHGVPAGSSTVDLEVKWSPHSGNWIRDNLPGPKREHLTSNLLGLLPDHGAVLLTSSFAYGAIAQWDEEKAREQSYIYAFERIQAYAEAKDDVAIVICDSESDRRTTKARVQQTFELVTTGSPYVRLDRIYKHAWAVDSKFHAGIQLADLVVGITSCMMAGNTKWALKYWGQLQGQFMFLPDCQAPLQYGITILPTPVRAKFIADYNPYGWAGLPSFGIRTGVAEPCAI